MNNIGPSVYLASDKNIYDALQHQKVHHAAILKFLRLRGIIVSSDMEKPELSRLFATLVLDYHDVTQLKQLLENPNRKEKTTRSVLPITLDHEKLLTMCQDVSEFGDGEESSIVINRGDSVVLVVTYTDIDFTKTELRQRSTKRCEVELQTNNGEVAIRMPATSKGKEVASRVIQTIKNSVEDTIEEKIISLSSIQNPEGRSYFFDRLIQLVTGYELIDVSRVEVNSKIHTEHGEDVNLDDDSEDEGEGEGETNDGYAGRVVDVRLSGGSVLESEQFVQLHQRGFFITKIIWTAADNLAGGLKVELEAQFGNTEFCDDFSYVVRNVYNYNNSKKSHNVTSRSPSAEEKRVFHSKLEEAAQVAFDQTCKKYEPAND